MHTAELRLCSGYSNRKGSSWQENATSLEKNGYRLQLFNGKDNKNKAALRGPEMLKSNTFDNTHESDGQFNPYAADRIVAESTDRQIEKLGKPSALVYEQATPQREFTPEERVAMRSVKTGLQYYYSGIYLVTFCFFVDSFLSRLIGPQVATLVSVGTTLGFLIVLYGEIRCLSTPQETGGFKHILLSVFFYALFVVLFVLKLVLHAQGKAMLGLVIQINIVQLMVGFLANFFFLTFIICVTRFMRNHILHEKAVKIRRAIWSMVGFVFIVVFVIAIMLNQFPPNARQLVVLVFGLSALAFIILVYSWLSRFTRLVMETCNAINVDHEPTKQVAVDGI